MKFVSKNSNLLIVLRPGIPGSHITGTPSKPMVSARFKDGVLDTDDSELIVMLRAHPAFGGDFISTEESLGTDPYAYLREGAEPEHTMTEIKFGQPVGSGKPAKITFPPEVKKALQEQAMEMAKIMAAQMAPAMAAEYLKQAVSEKTASATVTVGDTPSLSDTLAPSAPKASKAKANQKTQAE